MFICFDCIDPEIDLAASLEKDLTRVRESILSKLAVTRGQAEVMRVILDKCRNEIDAISAKLSAEGFTAGYKRESLAPDKED
jgi:BMFP domain-containing protein YqiC